MSGYRHRGVGVLRTSAAAGSPSWWPTLSDEANCRAWLGETWPAVAAAVGHASPVLSGRVAAILDGTVSGPDVSRATLAVVRYTLRFGRSMPFGLFAGVGAATAGEPVTVRLGRVHRPLVRADCRWLRPVIDRLEACPEVLARLDVVFNDAAQESGGRLRLAGAEAVSIRATAAVGLVREAAASPVQFAVLADVVRTAFPRAGDPGRMLVSLLDKGFLISSLRAPGTVVDSLGHVVDRLREIDADGLPVAELARELSAIHKAISEHNEAPNESDRTALAARLRSVADSVRVPYSIDLRLDAQVQVPCGVVREMERAAGVLARLVREHTGTRPWRDWFGAFCDRYGTGSLVPLRIAVDPDAGLGWPHGYPDSAEASGRRVLSERDLALFSLAAEATADGSGEVVLTNATVDALASAGGEPDTIPPHIDMGARIHASSRVALERGEYTFTVVPGRAAGTLSSRFSPLVPELAEVFTDLPTTVAGSVPVQLSFTPMYPSAENVARVPAYLPDVLSVGEHTSRKAISVDDLAITATRRRLHLVSLSRRCVIEPVVLHALALKQQPPMARFLGEVSRALDSGWLGFDWGAVADALPFLPRIRYGRAVLCPARWRLSRADLPGNAAEWDRALTTWRMTWRCPARVELRDFDQLLPLDLDVPVHREVLYRHVRANDDAVLMEAPGDDDANGWLDGYAHTVVFPMISQQPPEQGPTLGRLPILGREHGHVPGSTSAEWLYAKAYVPASHMDRFIVEELSALLSDLGDRATWFVRWPQTRDDGEGDHLRIRVRTDSDPEKAVAVISAWAERLRHTGRMSRFAFETYYPETGRYLAIAEAENVFAADSLFVLSLLTHAHGGRLSPESVTAMSLFDVASAFLGGRDRAAAWLSTQTHSAVPDRDHVEQVVRLARGGLWEDVPGWHAIAPAHQVRAEALATYRAGLPVEADPAGLLPSLLHMHHNRALGVDRRREAICLRLARQVGATWRATRAGRP